MSGGKEYRCVQCGFEISSLFVQYSPGNIRLMKCENCKAVADEYIECEIMILLIDLILHKLQAYRHLLHNTLFRDNSNSRGLLFKSVLGFLVLDAYRNILLHSSNVKRHSSMKISSFLGSYQKICLDLFLGNLIFLCTFHLAARKILNISAGTHSYKDLFLAIIISSYFKMFLITMMVWEFPSTVIYIIDIFVLSSNAVAVKVISERAMNRCIGTCFCAHASKFLVTQLLHYWDGHTLNSLR